MSAFADLPAVPEKLSFKIGEAARLVGVEPHVLRFWEKEFSRVRPQKGRNGHRQYSQSDVRLLRRIRGLLHHHRYTIAGAKVLLREGEEAVMAVLDGRPLASVAALDEAATEVEALRERLEALEGERAAAERDQKHAREEAAFWRRAARRAEDNVRRLESTVHALADAVRDEATSLKRAVSAGRTTPPQPVDTGVGRP